MKMKSLFLTVLLCIVPMLLFAQNYEKKGDELFQQAKYGEALKQYNAAVEFSGEGNSLLNKQKKAENCKNWLEQAIKAENTSKFAEASRLYQKLYDVHPLEKYNSKAQSLGAKAEQQAKAAEQQHINKWYEQGVQYFNEGNVRDAQEYLLKAAEKGHADAQYYYAELQIYEDYYGRRYYDEAIEWFEKAANQGNANAQYKLGYCYENGKGVAKDESKALSWYMKAGKQDHLNALTVIADYVYKNRITKDKVYWCEKGAKLGILKAQYLLAECYYNGKGVKQNSNTALEWYKKAKDTASDYYYSDYNSSHEDEINIYKRAYEKVEELTQTIDKQKKISNLLSWGDELFAGSKFGSAITWYEKAIALEKNAETYYKLGYCNEQIKKYDLAVQNYKQAALGGYPEAQYRLGLCLEQGKGVTANATEALEWYREATAKGHSGAKKELSRLDTKQKQLQQIASWKSTGANMFNRAEYNRSIEYYQKAANAGDIESLYHIGECYYRQAQYSQAIDWYHKAANENIPEAQFRLGYCYEEGKGISQNYSEAVKWYTKAASQGHLDAQCHLAHCYENGLGVTKDIVTAVKWYQMAADKGNANAQYYIGDCYSKGIVKKKNQTEAAKYYEKAAMQDDAKAQYKMGKYYNKGIGVPLNKSKSYNWYSQAANNGHTGAKMTVAQQDYFDENGKLELTWLGVNASVGTGYEIGASLLRLRYLWFQLNMLDFTFGDTFINKDMYSEPFIFYQPSFNAIIPVYENGAAYFGIGPSWDIYSETSCQLKVEAGFRFNYGRSSSSDVYLRYDGTAFTIGASIQWSSKFIKNSK